MLAKRGAVAADEKSEAEATVSKYLLELLEETGAKRIAAYRALPGEISVDGFWQQAFESGVKVCFPRVLGPGEMEFVDIVSKDDFSAGRFGVLEPTGQANPPEAEVDLVLVPGLAFDLKGYRLGFGGGYYDRALAAIESLRVGVVFDFQILARVPRESWDVPVHQIVSPRKRYLI